MWMDIQVLKQFRVISELENMSRAAKELHVAQPSLSVAMAKIERDLGVLLFHRSKKGVKLTAAGHRFLKYCEQSLCEWEQIQTELNHITSEVAGAVQLGVHPSVAIYTLPHFLPNLMAKFPALRLQLTHDLSRRIMQMVVQQELDAGLIINPEPRPNRIVRYLIDDEVTLFKPSKLVNGNLLIYDSNLSQIQAIRRQMELQEIRFERTLESSNLEVISHLLLSGLGHAVLPRRVLASLGHAFEESFPRLIKPVRDRLALVYHPDFVKTAKGKAVVEAVRAWGQKHQ
jgi:DNA-binding transcriptional LysR family regulator